ncbi:hypothetical protein JS541_09905 [Bifidobacterium sp. SO1]|nr:hypothetical protein [Bifidobacterium sp. SO1]
MDDITEVSSSEQIERKNTFMLTKNTEARSRTVFSVIGGGVVGLVCCVIVASLFGGGTLGWAIGSAFILAGMVLAPFLLVGTIKDRTQQARWKRLYENLQSRKIEGQVFYPNSTHPENIVDFKEMEVR